MSDVGTAGAAEIRRVPVPWRRSIRARLVWSVAAVHLLLVALVVGELVARERAFLLARNAEETTSLARALALNATSWVLANDVVGLQEVIAAWEGYPGLRYAMVVSPDGRVLAHTDGTRVGLFLEDGRSRSLLAGAPRTETVFSGPDLLDVASPVLAGAGNVVGWARIATGRESIQASLAEVTRNGVLFALAAGALGAAVAWAVSRRTTRELSSLVAVADQVRDVNDPRRAPVRGEDEVARLAASFNVMLDALQREAAERRRAEEASRRQAQEALSARLAAMGTLVAGVAHEVNNPLVAGISGQAVAIEILRDLRARSAERAPLDPEVLAGELDEAVEALEDGQAAAQRISQIVKDLSNFGHPDPQRRRTPLAATVAEAVRWLPATVTSVADVRVEDLGVPDAMVSPGQLQQVVVNLVTNAAKATAPGARGRIEVRLGPGAPGMARVEVADAGVGIPAAIRERIFEPFFTTRPTGEGRGTGLGLAVSHAIVTANGGTLTVESEVGRGSTFRLELPAAQGEG